MFVSRENKSEMENKRKKRELIQFNGDLLSHARIEGRGMKRLVIVFMEV